MCSTIPKKFHTTTFVQAQTREHEYLHRCMLSQNTKLQGWEKYTWTEEDFIKIVAMPEWYIPNAKKLLVLEAWAIISDIIRLYALYEYGGSYADWDVEFVRSIPEAMLQNESTVQYLYASRAQAKKIQSTEQPDAIQASTVQINSEQSYESKLILGFEPYTLEGRANAQVGLQCCISSPKHQLWRTIYKRIQDDLWTERFTILPGLCTRVLEEQYNLPKLRNNTIYYYLSDGVSIVPVEVFYPFMGTRVFRMESIEEQELYSSLQNTTIAIHWEHSQMQDAKTNKLGWTKYLHKLRENDE